MNSEKCVKEEESDRMYDNEQVSQFSDYGGEYTNRRIGSENSDESYAQNSGQEQVIVRGERRRGFWYRVKDGFLRRTAPLVNRLVPQEWRMTKSQRKLVKTSLANNIEVNVIDRETRYVPIVQIILGDIEQESVESLTSNDLEDDQNMRIIPSLAENEWKQIHSHSPSVVAMDMISQEIEVSAIDTGTDPMTSEEGMRNSSGYGPNSDGSLSTGGYPTITNDLNRLSDKGYADAMVAATNFRHFEAVRDRNGTPTEIAGSHSLAAVDCIFPVDKLLADCSADSQPLMIHESDGCDNKTGVLTHLVTSSLVDSDDISFNETYQDSGDTDSIESSRGQALAQILNDCKMIDSEIYDNQQNSDNSGNEEKFEEFFDTVSIVSIYSNNSGMDSSQSDAMGLLSESYLNHFFNEQSESILSLYSDDTGIDSSHSEAIGNLSENYLDQFYEDMSMSNISIDSENADIETTRSDRMEFSDDLWEQYSMSILSIYSTDISEDSLPVSDTDVVSNERVSEVLQNQWTQIQTREQMEMEFNWQQNWMTEIDLVQFLHDFGLDGSNQIDDQLSQDHEEGNLIYDIGKIVLICLYIIQLLSVIC